MSINSLTTYRSFLRLSAEAREDLMSRLNEHSGLEGSRIIDEGRNRRTNHRLPWSQENLKLAVHHPGGGMSKFLVVARNISTGGLGFLHGGFLHPGTRCDLVLPRLTGEPEKLRTIVVNCRHVEGTAHEVGVTFEKPIDPCEFHVEAAALLQQMTEHESAAKAAQETAAMAEADDQPGDDMQIEADKPAEDRKKGA